MPRTWALLMSGAWITVHPGCASAPRGEPTQVVQVSPADGAEDGDVQIPVQAHFSRGLTLTSITPDTVRLTDPAGTAVPAQLSSDIEGDVVNVQPRNRLRPGIRYTLEVNAGLLDRDGGPVSGFRSGFTTGRDAPRTARSRGFVFAKRKVEDETGPTAIAVGPDGNVYVSTYQGELHRVRIDPANGQSIGREKLLEIPGKKILGLTFDPGATSSELVAWITHDDRKAENVDQGTFSGTVSRVSIPAADRVVRDAAAVETRYIVGLPSGWHPLNGCAFGPDGRLYVSVGSMNRLGDDPLRPETPLSAAVVVADVRDPRFHGGAPPLDVQTSGPVHYDPYAPGASLTVHATGFREMYRICWHSNGNLYGGVNQNDGTTRADTPSRPGVPSLRSVFPDEDLVRIVQGGYYGHPNPSRSEVVLLGGNPTGAADPWEVAEYPVGVLPEPAFHPENLIFNLKAINGTSANGCTEYTLPGALHGRLLICFFEGTHTVHTFAFNAAGTAVTDHRPLLGEDGESLKFTQPLDVAVHPSGRIYVADFGAWSSFGGGGAIWVLDPLADTNP